MINPSALSWYGTGEKLAFSSPRNQPSTLFAARCLPNSSMCRFIQSCSRSYTIVGVLTTPPDSRLQFRPPASGAPHNQPHSQIAPTNGGSQHAPPPWVVENLNRSISRPSAAGPRSQRSPRWPARRCWRARRGGCGPPSRTSSPTSCGPVLVGCWRLVSWA